MGVVYKAEDTKLGYWIVAIKTSTLSASYMVRGGSAPVELWATRRLTVSSVSPKSLRLF